MSWLQGFGGVRGWLSDNSRPQNPFGGYKYTLQVLEYLILQAKDRPIIHQKVLDIDLGVQCMHEIVTQSP